MKHPTGITVSAVLLGIAAPILILVSALSTLASGRIGQFVATAQPTGSNPAAYPMPPLSGLVSFLLVLESMFFLLLAAWAVFTLVGLLRLRDWARISVLILAGCLTTLGVINLLPLLTLAALVARRDPGSDISIHTMQVALAGDGIFSLITLSAGAWWLVYFNRRAIKARFIPKAPRYVPNDASFSSTRLPPPPSPGRYTAVPTTIKVLAGLFFFAAICALAYSPTPFPAFVCGLIFTGLASHLFYLTMALLTSLIGFGLLRLDNRARIATYTLLAFGTLSLLLIPTPWYRHQFARYNEALYAQMHIPMPISPAAFITLPVMLVSALFGLAINFVVAYLLHQQRAAFSAEPAQPSSGPITP